MPLFRILIMLLILLSAGCQNQKKYILKKQKLADVLVDIYLLDAMYSSQTKFPVEYNQIDSAGYYSIAFQKHNVTKAAFDSSINYYTKKPDELDEIYEIVLTTLSKTEARINQTVLDGQNTEKSNHQDLWSDKKTWNIPEDGEHNKIDFTLTLPGPGTYTISARLRLSEEDESVNPRLTAYFARMDENGNEVKLHFNPKSIPRTSAFTTISTTRKLTNENYTLLRGAILDHSNQDTDWTKHAEVEDIEVLYTPLEE
ncbi:MAG: DUF4296 domain-containing protein [Bacteroidota bacterium]